MARFKNSNRKAHREMAKTQARKMPSLIYQMGFNTSL